MCHKMVSQCFFTLACRKLTHRYFVTNSPIFCVTSEHLEVARADTARRPVGKPQDTREKQLLRVRTHHHSELRRNWRCRALN